MTIDRLITAMITGGVKLVHLGGGKLGTRGNRRALTPDLLAAIREHKRELLHRMAEVERRDGTDGPGDLAKLLEQEVAARAKEKQSVRKGNQAGTTSQKSVNLSPVDTQKCVAKSAGKKGYQISDNLTHTLPELAKSAGKKGLQKSANLLPVATGEVLP